LVLVFGSEKFENSMIHSLLVPCYNAEKYIDSFLGNFSRLSVPFDEMIFYDDGSTDQTARLLKYSGCRVIEGGTNMGPGHARNQLAKAARGAYIHFHDIDDEIDPLFISKVDEKIKNYKPDVILGNADWLDSRNRELVISWKYNEAELQNDPVSYLLSHPLGIINTVYKREAFLSIKGFNEQIHCWEDADLHVRLAVAGNSFSVIDAVLAYSIRHNLGISENQGWCWKCRLAYLEGYKRDFAPRYLAVLGIEFEKTANGLLYNNQAKDAMKAFAMSRACGFDAPYVNRPLFKTLKKVSPLFAFLLKGLVIKLKAK
jgi:glycosyltransferase involved in cell wall biosynthesis